MCQLKPVAKWNDSSLHWWTHIMYTYKHSQTDRLATFHAPNNRPHWQRWHSRLVIRNGGGRCHDGNKTGNTRLLYLSLGPSNLANSCQMLSNVVNHQILDYQILEHRLTHTSKRYKGAFNFNSNFHPMAVKGWSGRVNISCDNLRPCANVWSSSFDHWIILWIKLIMST